MKLKIKQNILMNYLNYSIRGVSNKNLIPILNCIKFDLKDEGLYLTSTDNEISIKTFIPSKDIESIDSLGDMVVSGRFIYDIIKKLPGEIIDIEEVMDSKLYITTKKSSFTLNCNDVNDFPDLKFNEKENPIILNNKVLRNIINETIFATSTQESRPALTGINIKIEDIKLECTATDSFRLAKKYINLEKKVDENINIIIPTRSLNELIKMIEDNDEKIELHIFDNKILFKSENIIMMSSLINGTYPDTTKLIPSEFETILTVNLNDYYNAIDRASLLTNESDKNTIKLESNKTEAIISSTIPEIGNVKETINIKNNKDEEINISFSSKYMLDAIKTFDSDEIELCFNGDIKPIIIRSKENEDLIQLIVPIRTY
ncbi:MAG: DNA polymerase III subunit beta [Bacilli bacterium]|nr:DNA polymerase III subunit beta [Bacilli bacterium]